VKAARGKKHLAAALVCAALVVTAGPMLLNGGARAGPAPPPATTTRAVHDGTSTVAELRDRRLRAQRVEHGQPCPSADVNLRLNGVGPAVQAGPVAVALLGEDVALRYGDQQTAEGRHPVKALWLVGAEQAQPVIVRGKRIDGRGAVEFRNGRGRDFRTYPLTGDAESTAPPEWRDIPSQVFVRGSGCYALQVDGPDFQSIFVLAAEPRSSGPRAT
jgi:hypothetical protein